MIFQINHGVLRRDSLNRPIHGRGFSYPDDIRWIVISDDVTSISAGAFQDCAHLKSIVIPDSVTEIGQGAFEGCVSLQSIAIPPGVTEIRASLFKDCESLQSISLPDGLTRIEKRAFSKCLSLAHLSIPDNVTEIAPNAFEHCEALVQIDLPAGITEISRDMFYVCTSLESIAIPEGVTAICSGAFDECTSLRQITLPASVGRIDAYAFHNCKSLESIDIPEGVSEIMHDTFKGCASLTRIGCPTSITAIGDEAFLGCKSLTAFNLPEGVTRIGDSAFYQCESLKSLSVPDCLLHWGRFVFSEQALYELFITSEDGRYGAWRSEFALPLDYCLRKAVLIHTGDLASLPVSYIEAGLWAYAADVAADPARRTAANQAFIAQNAASLLWLAFRVPKLLELMCSDRLIGPEALPLYTTYARCYCDDEALKAQILAYAGPNAGTAAEAQTASQTAGHKKAAALTRTDPFAGRVYVLEHRDYLAPWPQGVNVLQPGEEDHFSLKYLRTDDWPKEVAVVLRALGASIAPWVSDGADVFVRTSDTATPASLRAEALGVEIISSDEFLTRLSAIREIRIPDDVETLKGHAFYGMSGLERVALPAGLKRLSDGAFEGTSVRMVVIPNARCSIGCFLDDSIVYLLPTAEQVAKYNENTNVAYMGNIDDLPGNVKTTALQGFLRLEALGSDALSPWRDGYIRCARSSRKRQLALVNNAVENIPIMLRLQMVSAAAIPAIRDALEGMGDVEQLALLLDYEAGLSPLARQRAEESAERGFERQLRRMAESAERKANACGIAGLTFVAVPDLKHWDIYQGETGIGRRQEALKAFIEKRGGRLRSSVTGNTDYLIAGDPLGENARCQRARKMEIEIISEDEFLHRAGVHVK